MKLHKALLLAILPFLSQCETYPHKERLPNGLWTWVQGLNRHVQFPDKKTYSSTELLYQTYTYTKHILPDNQEAALECPNVIRKCLDYSDLNHDNYISLWEALKIKSSNNMMRDLVDILDS